MAVTKEDVIRTHFYKWYDDWEQSKSHERRIIKAIEEKDYETIELMMFQAYKAGFDNGESI